MLRFAPIPGGRPSPGRHQGTGVRLTARYWWHLRLPSRPLPLAPATSPVLQRRLALALFQARDEPEKASVPIRVEVHPDGSTGTQVESRPPIPADACATVLARPEIGGAGVVTFLAELQRRP